MSSTTTTSSSTATCPYAAARPSDQDALQQCPAFAHNHCPFKDAKNATHIKRTLQQMPESHLKNHSFLQILQDMHQVQPAAASAFQIPGGCPIQVQVVRRDGVSFRQALEQMSLSAIMAGWMEAEEENEEEEKERDTTRHAEATRSTTAAMDDTTPTQQHSSLLLLSESLKTGTASSHQAAENVHFVKNFIQGKIDRDLYATMVGMLYHVYVALEECLEKQASQHFPTCHFPHELRRTETLASDVDFWWGSSKQPPVSTATQEYVDRLYHLAQHDPLLLLAHAYTRYLGDLSGGKVLARVARRALSLHTDGLEFYEFKHIPSVKRFKDMYRQALDALPLTEEQIQRVVAEANVAFCLNMRLFEELDVQANVPGATVRPLEDALAYATRTPSTAGASEECPFLKKKDHVAKKNAQSTQRCSWPFVFAHDPAQGMKDWQTWLVLGLIMCWVWNMLQAKLV